MRATINRKNIMKAVTGVVRAVEPRNVMPVLGCVLLQVDHDTVSVSATDLNIYTSSSVEATDCAAGRICVDARMISDIVKKGAADEVHIELDDDRLIVKCGRGRYSLSTLSPEDFPKRRSVDDGVSLRIDLRSLVAPVVYAQSKEELRFFLNGVRISGGGMSYTADATNGHVFAKSAIDGDVAFDKVIIPTKAIGLIPKGEVELTVGEKAIRMVGDGIEVTSATLDGDFPDLDTIANKGCELSVTCSASELAAAVDRASVANNEKYKTIHLSIIPGALEVRANSSETDASDEIAIEYSGEPRNIAFNSRYLLDTLASLGDNEITFEYNGPHGLPLFKSPDQEGWGATIMPLKVASDE